MINNDVKIEIVTIKEWGNKSDPTEYDYISKTIRIREDYFKQMNKSNPITHHWIYYEFAHYLVATKYGKEYVIAHSNQYPDNRIERFCFAYQFYYLMETKSCNTLNDLINIDPFFKHKKIYQRWLDYYWNNAHFIISEFKSELGNIQLTTHLTIPIFRI